jgi:hypothetical protein
MMAEPAGAGERACASRMLMGVIGTGRRDRIIGRASPAKVWSLSGVLRPRNAKRWEVVTEYL